MKKEKLKYEVTKQSGEIKISSEALVSVRPVTTNNRTLTALRTGQMCGSVNRDTNVRWEMFKAMKSKY